MVQENLICKDPLEQRQRHTLPDDLRLNRKVNVGCRRRTKEEWKWAVEGLQAVVRRAEHLGVTLCLEPLNRFETYFLNTLQDASQLIHEIGTPNIRIHVDTFHGNIEEKKPATRTKSRITSTLFNCPPCLPTCTSVV